MVFLSCRLLKSENIILSAQIALSLVTVRGQSLWFENKTKHVSELLYKHPFKNYGQYLLESRSKQLRFERKHREITHIFRSH